MVTWYVSYNILKRRRPRAHADKNLKETISSIRPSVHQTEGRRNTSCKTRMPHMQGAIASLPWVFPILISLTDPLWLVRSHPTWRPRRLRFRPVEYCHVLVVVVIIIEWFQFQFVIGHRDQSIFTTFAHQPMSPEVTARDVEDDNSSDGTKHN